MFSSEEPRWVQAMGLWPVEEDVGRSLVHRGADAQGCPGTLGPLQSTPEKSSPPGDSSPNRSHAE